MSRQDYFGKPAVNLNQKKLWLLDMDGTIYEENRVFEGTLDFLKRIEELGGRYMFITNNSSKSVSDYVEKVHRMGIPADEDTFFTSTQATIRFLKQHYPNTKVFCQGTKSFLRELQKEGICATEDVEEDVGLVLCGFDTELTMQKMWNTCILLNRGLPFYATNPDLVCPVSIGYIPDCGSVCQMYYNATKRRPIFIGKPEPTMIQICMEKYGFTNEDTIVIGDRLYTDIASGNRAQVTTILVLSGEATLEDLEQSEDKPTYVFESIRDIL